MSKNRVRTSKAEKGFGDSPKQKKALSDIADQEAAFERLQRMDPGVAHAVIKNCFAQWQVAVPLIEKFEAAWQESVSSGKTVDLGERLFKTQSLTMMSHIWMHYDAGVIQTDTHVIVQAVRRRDKKLGKAQTGSVRIAVVRNRSINWGGALELVCLPLASAFPAFVCWLGEEYPEIKEYFMARTAKR